MGRKIVLLSDGTGNSVAKIWKTNVWRVFERLDLSNDDQVACYDDGVGTAAFKPFAVLGGAFGWGLKRNLIDLYKFACRNYRVHVPNRPTPMDGQDSDCDEIYAFGFSRGAFTIRLVVDMICQEGLLPHDLPEDELDSLAKAAYRSYRSRNFHTKWPAGYRPEDCARRLRDLVLKPRAYETVPKRTNVKIRFVGLWDTVAAYGMPVEEFARGISYWVWPWVLPDTLLHKNVLRACHALSIDDERSTFHPILWDERDEAPLAADAQGARLLRRERISQVWFAGAHSNIGGGYPDDSLVQIPLTWILQEAKACGLRFKSVPDANPQTYAYPFTAQDKDGRLYDPRKGLGSYYRYGPRDLTKLATPLLCRKGSAATLRIHQSVIARIRNRAHPYAPLGLPARYEIVDHTGAVHATTATSEEPTQALARWHAQQGLWNKIFARRVVYFLTLFMTIYALAFPLAKAASSVDEVSSAVRWVADLVRTIGSFLPRAARPWIDGYAWNPGHTLVVGAALASLMALSAWLSKRIRSHMGLLWQASLAGQLIERGCPGDAVYRFRNSRSFKTIHRLLKGTLVPAAFALVAFWCILALVSRVTFVLMDDAGFVCTETDVSQRQLPRLSRNEILVRSGDKWTTRNLSDLRREVERRIKADPQVAEKLQGNSLHNPFVLMQALPELELPEFKTSEICQSMQVFVEHRQSITIRFQQTADFKDRDIDARDGFGTLEWRDGRSIGSYPVFLVALPFRRELFRQWFTPVARIGAVGGEEFFLDPDPSERHYRINETFQATRGGELFLFVNDAVVPVPGSFGGRYENNQGATRVLIIGNS